MNRRSKRKAEFEEEERPWTRAIVNASFQRETRSLLSVEPGVYTNIIEESSRQREDVVQLKVLKQKIQDGEVNEQQDVVIIPAEDSFSEITLGQVEQSPRKIDWKCLPDDILIRIFSFLGFRDVARLACVCHAWQRLSASPALWSHLDVRAYNLDSDVADSLAIRCANLQELRLKGNAASVSAARLCATRLRVLKGDACQDLSDATMAMLAARHPYLHVLHLVECSRLTSDALKITAFCCPRLRKLRLEGVPRLDAEALCALASNCHDLVDVAFVDCGLIDEKSLSGLQQVRRLSVGGSSIQWLVAADHLALLSNLEAFDVSRTDIPLQIASRILAMPKLKVLCVLHCSEVISDGSLCYSPNLKTVIGSSTDISKALALFTSWRKRGYGTIRDEDDGRSNGVWSVAKGSSREPDLPKRKASNAFQMGGSVVGGAGGSKWTGHCLGEEAQMPCLEIGDWLELVLAHALHKMSDSKNEGLEPFWLHQGPLTLVNLLDSPDEDVQERAAYALGTFVVKDDVEATVDKGRAEAVLKFGGISRLLAMAQSRKEGLQAEAAKALANLSVHFEVARAVAQEGGIVVLTHLAQSPNKGVVEEAAGGFWNLSVGEEHKALIAAAGGIPVLVSLTLKQALGNEGILERAAGALANLAADDTVSMAVAAAGGVKALVQLARFCKQDGIVEQAARALGNLAAHGESNCHTEAVGRETGALETLVQLTASSSESVRQEAAGALWNLSFDDRNREAIASVGGVEALVALARACSQVLQETVPSVSLQERAAGALWGLSVSEANSIAIGREGGIGPLIILAQSQTMDVHETAAGALWNLAFNPSNAAMIVEGGGVPALVQLCKTSQSPMARFMAALALAYMFDCGSCNTGKEMFEGRRMALPSIEAFLRSCMNPGNMAAAGAVGAVGQAGEAALALVAKDAGIPEAGHLRCSGAELSRFVKMLRNPRYPVLRTCAAFALLQFTMPLGKHSVHHAQLLRGTSKEKGEGHRLRSAAALSCQTVEAKAFIRVVLRNLAMCEKMQEPA